MPRPGRGGEKARGAGCFCLVYCPLEGLVTGQHGVTASGEQVFGLCVTVTTAEGRHSSSSATFREREKERERRGKSWLAEEGRKKERKERRRGWRSYEEFVCCIYQVISTH